MPKGFKGIVMAIVVTLVSMAIINRVEALRKIVNP